MARKKINQSDLRRLMKERCTTVSKEEKVESPLAKYDKFGKLSCVACNEEVKIAWRHHILSRIHKENINKKLKRKSQAVDVAVSNDAPKSKYHALSAVPSQTVNGKSLNHRKEAESVSQVPTRSKIAEESQKVTKSSGTLIQGYSSSSSEEEELGEETSSKANSLTKDQSDVLPPGFFDVQPSASMPSTSVFPQVQSEKVLPVANDPLTNSAQEGLPEGFFDDPILDAKARKVEYKDPIEEEWEKFQKVMAEEANVSQNMMDQDMEKSEVERDIDQIEQMIYSWQKVNDLQSKGEELHQQLYSKKSETDKNESEDSSVEENDLEYLLDWRAKGSVKK